MANRQETINEALSVIRKTQFAMGNRGSLQHFQANDRAAMEAALTHPACAKCDHLLVVFPPKGPKHVKLNCRKNLSPIALGQDWFPLDAPRTCPDCTDPAGRPTYATTL